MALAMRHPGGTRCIVFAEDALKRPTAIQLDVWSHGPRGPRRAAVRQVNYAGWRNTAR